MLGLRRREGKLVDLAVVRQPLTRTGYPNDVDDFSQSLNRAIESDTVPTLLLRVGKDGTRGSPISLRVRCLLPKPIAMTK